MGQEKEPLPFTAAERAIARFFAPRMLVWLLLTLVLIGALFWLARHMLPVLLWKVTLLSTAAFFGDKIARAIEWRNRRPHELLETAAKCYGRAHDLRNPDDERGMDLARGWQLEQRADGIYQRRAIVIGCAMIAAALGS